ncbi:MAG: ATP-binding protein [Methanobacteriaceae archaeon]|nr:ATP-binding protein [Methanobacteriaceae archaeon]
MKNAVLKYLKNINVDTRFISLVGKSVYINNLRFSKFSRRKEQLFIHKFPDYEVIRSKIFQKICSRTAKILVNNIKPHDNIFLLDKNNWIDFTVLTVLEPYQRKYGVKLFIEDSFDKMNTEKIDVVASNINLDDEVENILHQILNGDKIQLLSSKNYYDKKCKIRMIYPLLNVPRKWISIWLDIEDNIDICKKEDIAISLLDFLEKHVPDTRENIYKSSVFISNNKRNNQSNIE